MSHLFLGAGKGAGVETEISIVRSVILPPVNQATGAEERELAGLASPDG